jgi:hypothetical protein
MVNALKCAERRIKPPIGWPLMAAIGKSDRDGDYELISG